MTLIQTAFYYIFKVNGREFHYPKAVWTEEAAMKDLMSYLEQLEKKKGVFK